MNHTEEKRSQYARRKKRVRAKVMGTSERPRLSVFRSLRHVSVQLIDDTEGRTIASASDREIGSTNKKKTGGKTAAAALVGALIAERGLEKKINSAVFDRGGRRYHGAVAAVAEAARKGGLNL